MNVLEAVSAFNLEALSSDWVDELWGSDFLEDRDLPEEFVNNLEDDDFLHLMSVVIDAIKDLKRTQDTDNSSTITWQDLVNLKFDHKSFICFISTFIKSNYTCQDSRILGLIASRLYVNLLSIPGATILNVFNPLLYQKVISALSLSKLCSSPQGSKKHKKKCKSTPTENVCQDSDQTELHESEKEAILLQIGLLLKDLSECFLTLHLADEFDSLKETIKILVELTRLEKHDNVYSTTSNESSSVASVALMAYEALEGLCVEEQGNVKSIVMYISHCLLPSLILNEEDYKMQIMEKSNVHSHTLSFIKKILSKRNQGIEDGVMALFQQLCIRLPEKEEIKGKLVPKIIEFLLIFNKKLFNEAILWVVALMHNKTLKHRLAAADIVSGLLDGATKINQVVYHDHTMSPHVPGPSRDTIAPERKQLFITLIAAALSGICDSSSTMKSKCLNIFNKLLLSSHLEIKEIIHTMYFSNLIKNIQAVNDKPASCMFDFYTFFEHNPTTFPSDPLPEGKRLTYLIYCLTSDEKVFVRKNACQALTNICLVNETYLTTQIVKVLIFRCKDICVSVRKSVAKNLTDLLIHYPNKESIISAWVDGVVQLVVDNETKSVEKVLEYCKSVLIENITRYENTKEDINILPWEVLRIISKKEKTNLLGIICHQWIQQGFIKAPMFRILQTHIGTKFNNEVWYFISCLSKFTTIPDSDFIYNYFIENIHATSKVGEYLCLHVLESLYLNRTSLKQEYQEDLFLKFKTLVENFSAHFIMIPRCMDYLYCYKNESIITWCGIIVEKCESNLKGSPIVSNENLICQYIVTLGEAALFRPGVRSETLTYLANIIDRTFTTSGSQNEGGRWIRTASTRLRSVSLVTLGKICLQDHYISKTYAPLIAGLLNNRNSETTLKINAMVILSDLCRRFTSVVEDYLGNMFISLRDNDVKVRKNSLTLLMSLIQEDYLRVKKHILFYFLIMLLDKSQEIRDLTESFLVNNLQRKQPKIFSQYFISSIMFFNDFEVALSLATAEMIVLSIEQLVQQLECWCSSYVSSKKQKMFSDQNWTDEIFYKIIGIDHPSFKMDDLSQPERIVFCMAGVTRIKEREKIYRYMLNHMLDDERFHVSNKLCTEIMAYVNEDIIPLDQKGTAVLKDALSCLSWKEMRLENLRKQASPEETQTTKDVTEIARRMFLSVILRKNYSEHIIPIISQLKRKLMARKSPLVKDLMICLRELMKDFKDEVQDMLDDPLLAKEVEFDLQNVDIPSEEILETDMGSVILKDIKVVVERLSADTLLREFNIPMSAARKTTAKETPGLSSPPLDRAETTSEAEEPHTSTPSRRKGRVYSAFSTPLSPVPGSSRELLSPKKRVGRSQSTIVTSSPVVREPQTLEKSKKKKEIFSSPSPVSSPPPEFRTPPRRALFSPPSPQPGCSWMPDFSPPGIAPPSPDLPPLPPSPSQESTKPQRKGGRCTKSPDLPVHLELPEKEADAVSIPSPVPTPSSPPAGTHSDSGPKARRRRRRRKGSASSSVLSITEEPPSPLP